MYKLGVEGLLTPGGIVQSWKWRGSVGDMRARRVGRPYENLVKEY